MEQLIAEIRSCRICQAHLLHGCRPILQVHPASRIVLIGQAPGRRVHESGIPWSDKSGDNLRAWLQVSAEEFYDPTLFALVPMGFCYPGAGKTGDLPPRKECAPQWHPPLFDRLPAVELVLLVGQYAQAYYLRDKAKETLTDTVQNYAAYLPQYFPLPHPSPRNNIWMKKNPWFAAALLPELATRIARIKGGR